MKNSFEYRKAIQLFGKVDSNKNYTGIFDIMDAVASGEVEIGLVDASMALGYEQAMEEKSLRIYKVLDYQTGYGVVLSGDAVKLEADVRAFVVSNQAYISRFVEQQIGLLKPTLIEVEEMLFTPEEATFTFTTLAKCYLALKVLGIIYWLAFRRHRVKVQPQGTIVILTNCLSCWLEIFQKLLESLTILYLT